MPTSAGELGSKSDLHLEVVCQRGSRGLDDVKSQEDEQSPCRDLRRRGEATTSDASADFRITVES